MLLEAVLPALEEGVWSAVVLLVAELGAVVLEAPALWSAVVLLGVVVLGVVVLEAEL